MRKKVLKWLKGGSTLLVVSRGTRRELRWCQVHVQEKTPAGEELGMGKENQGRWVVHLKRARTGKGLSGPRRFLAPYEVVKTKVEKQALRKKTLGMQR